MPKLQAPRPGRQLLCAGYREDNGSHLLFSRQAQLLNSGQGWLCSFQSLYAAKVTADLS